MIEITEQDGELLIDGKPVDFQAPWKVEDAFRQLRGEIAERDARLERAEAELARLRAQEPVAWMWERNREHGWVQHHSSYKPDPAPYYRNIAPLYAEPMPTKVAG